MIPMCIGAQEIKNKADLPEGSYMDDNGVYWYEEMDGRKSGDREIGRAHV